MNDQIVLCRPRRFRKGADLDCEADLKENSDPGASVKKCTPSRYMPHTTTAPVSLLVIADDDTTDINNS